MEKRLDNTKGDKRMASGDLKEKRKPGKINLESFPAVLKQFGSCKNGKCIGGIDVICQCKSQTIKVQSSRPSQDFKN